MQSPLLISTDFDGTLFDEKDERPFAHTFFQWIEKTRKKRPVYWAINTGRGWPSLSESLKTLNAPIWPDWVVLVERAIHRVENRFPISFDSWNDRCADAHTQLFKRTQPLLDQMLEKFSTMQGLQIIDDLGSPFGLIAADLDQAHEVKLYIENTLKDEPELVTVCNSVYFRFAHRAYNKGTCLAAIRDELGLKPEQCFAIGDHFNDLPMLGEPHATHVGCPGNAIDHVKLTVKKRGGFVAEKNTYLGVVDALEYFFK